MIPHKQRRMAEQIMEAFTRQHYVAIAEMIHDMRHDMGGAENNSAIDNFVNRLAELFKRDNPAFDKARFISACRA